MFNIRVFKYQFKIRQAIAELRKEYLDSLKQGSSSSNDVPTKEVKVVKKRKPYTRKQIGNKKR